MKVRVHQRHRYREKCEKNYISEEKFEGATGIAREPNPEPTLVLATPISGPALMCTPQSESRLMDDPTVFVMPTIKAPRCLQYRRAFSVSAVSPEGVMCHRRVIFGDKASGEQKNTKVFCLIEDHETGETGLSDTRELHKRQRS